MTVQISSQTFDSSTIYNLGTPTARLLWGRRESRTLRKNFENVVIDINEAYISFLNNDDVQINTDFEKDYIKKLGFSVSLVEKAIQYMDLVVEKFIIENNCDIGNPGISLFEDGLLIEWVVPHARLGLFFDPEDESGSYYSYTDNPKDGISASGPLKKGMEKLLVDTFIHQVESLKEKA